MKAAGMVGKCGVHLGRRGRPARSQRTALLVLLLLAGTCSLVRAGFESGIVNFHSTTQHVPEVAACSDSAHGALVVWQEGPVGPLLAAHLLSNGERNPSWPTAGALVAPVSSELHGLGVVPDGDGGCYVWWSENGLLSVTRLDRTGVVASGWPAGGRMLGRMRSGEEPSTISDGSGGVYLGWYDIGLLPGQRWRILTIHLGRDGHSTGGWPDTPLAFETLVEEWIGLLPAFAPAPNGGLWAAWLAVVTDQATGAVSGGYRVSRLRPSGAPAPGWSRDGSEVVSVSGDLRDVGYADYGMRPVAIAGGGDGGFDLLSWDTEAGLLGYYGDGPVLSRFEADGSPAQEWPEAGVRVAGHFMRGAGIGASPRLTRTSDGGLLVGSAGFGVESTEYYDVMRLDQFGVSAVRRLSQPRARDIKIRFSPEGEVASAWAQPFGWHSWIAGESAWISGTYVAPGQPSVSFDEHQSGLWTVWYGDADIVLTGDGGAIFVWSQDIGRLGLQAMRLVPGGTVGVTPAGPATGLRVWFARGAGVQLLAEGATHVSLRLHDVTGRQVASGEWDTPQLAQRTVPGTALLPSGVYFAVGRNGETEFKSRVVIIR